MFGVDKMLWVSASVDYTNRQHRFRELSVPLYEDNTKAPGAILRIRQQSWLSGLRRHEQLAGSLHGDIRNVLGLLKTMISIHS